MGKAARRTRETPPLRLDLGCGDNKREGFHGVDVAKTASTDTVIDILKFPWPWADGAVAEVHSSHFFEHIPGKVRPKFMDELWRVLAVGGQVTLIVPYYANMRAVQDFTHEWPPVCEASFLYFNRKWREDNKLAHYPVTCDFDFTYGYAMAQDWAQRSEDAQRDAVRLYINVIQDLQVTLTKRAVK